MSFCHNCGAEQAQGAKFCPRCGSRNASRATYQASNESPRKPAPQISSGGEIADSSSVARQNAARPTADSSVPQPPYIVPPQLPFSEVFKEMQERHKGPLVAVFIVMVVSILCFITADSKKPFLERPIQYQPTHDGVYLSTMKSLSRYDASGSLLWKAERAGERTLNGMLDFEFGANGNIYAANTGRNRIEVFDEDGNWISGFGEDSLSGAFTLKTLRNGDVLVADAGKHNLKLFSAEGDLIKTIGKRGMHDGEFDFPNGVEQLPDGSALIAETNNLRAQTLDERAANPASRAFSLRGWAASPREMSSSLRPINWEVKSWPTRMVADAFRERLYVAYADDFVTPDGYVGVFDFNGEFIRPAFLSLPDGSHIDARKMKMTPDGMVSFTDIDECFAGIWNPDTDEVVAAPETEINDEMTRLAGIVKSNRRLGGIGRSLFAACLMALLAVLAYSVFLWDDMKTRGYVVSAATRSSRTQPAPRKLVPSLLISLLFPCAGQFYTRHFIFGLILASLTVLFLIPIYCDYMNIYSLGWFPIVWIPIKTVLIWLIAYMYIVSIIHVIIVAEK
ncbi:MAG TPA: zinc-ribbon domain-containing protein [bacterium]|nr:zinc-ribbon domain-containing protein [bacterium]